MKITFAQEDIVAAIKGYIMAQGVNLENKTIAVDFTMKRKGGGLSAEVSIDAAFALPAFTDNDEIEIERPQLTVVPIIPVLISVAAVVPEVQEIVSDPVPSYFVEEPVEVAEVPDEEEISESAFVPPTPVVKTTSLFN